MSARLPTKPTTPATIPAVRAAAAAKGVRRIVAEAAGVGDHAGAGGLSAAPDVVVARGFSPGPLPLGLDRPLRLLGGDRLGPWGVGYELPFRWHSRLIEIVSEAGDRQLVAGRPWLSLPPLLLVGPRGVGRTHVARRVASASGVPHVAVDAAAFDDDAPGVAARGPDTWLPSPVLVAMAASGCANPIVSVDVDGATRGAQDRIAAMIDPVRSARLVDDAIGAVVDLSQVSWLLQARPGSHLSPALLKAVETVELERPHACEELHRVSVLADAAADIGLGSPVAPGRILAALEAMARGPQATAALYAQAVGALAAWRGPEVGSRDDEYE